MSHLRFIDDRGRVFGRFNVIDFVAVAFIVLLLPLGYAAFWLLRPQKPQILGIDPPTLQAGQEQRVRLTGNNLRPFLRAVVGGKEAALFVGTPTLAEITLPELRPGSYDLVLYDSAQEVARKAGAIVINAGPPPPAPRSFELNVLGAFTGLDLTTAKTLIGPRKLGESGQPGSAEILYAQPPEPDVMRLKELPFVVRDAPDRLRVVALLRLRCAFINGDCKVADHSVSPGAVLTLRDGSADFSFEVTGLFPSPSDSLPEINVMGAFVGLDQHSADQLASSPPSTLSPPDSWSRVTSLSRSEPEIVRLRGKTESVGAGTTGRFQVRAALALRCAVVAGECKVGNTIVAPDSRVPVLTRRGMLTFEVSELYPAEIGLQSQARLSGTFVGLDAGRAASLSKLATSPETWGGILSLSNPELDGSDNNRTYKAHALLAVRCAPDGNTCKFGSTIIASDAMLSIPSSQGILTFKVTESYVADTGPLVDMSLNGAFVGLSMTRASALTKLQSSSPEFWGRVLTLGPPEPHGREGQYRVSASVSLRCTVIGSSCKFGNATVGPGTALVLPTSQGFLSFDVAELYAADAGPLTDLSLSGSFVGLEPQQLAALTKIRSSNGSAAESWGRVLSLGPPENETVHLGQRTNLTLPAVATGRLRVGAVIAVKCSVVGTECRIGSTSVMPDAKLTLRTTAGTLTFEVSDMYPADRLTSANVNVIGAFIDLDETRAGKLSTLSAARQSSQSWGRILSVRPVEPEQLRLKARTGGMLSAGTTDRFEVGAVITVRCTVLGSNCRIGNTLVAPDARIALPTDLGMLMFEIRDLYPADLTFVDVTIRGATDRTVFDLAQQDLMRKSPPEYLELQPRLIGLRLLGEGIALRTGAGNFNWDQTGVEASAIIRVPAQKDLVGWQYQGVPLRAGERFIYTQHTYTMAGNITEIHVVERVAQK